jgi:ParB-like chromosome segregation protein Spo0J
MKPKRKSDSEQADITHIKDLKPDQRNARKHNARNIGMIEDALNEVGAARSIVIDEDGRILAGNGTVEAAAQAGIERVKVVEADGEEIVAVRRRGLTEKQKRRLALFDNRTAELAEWEIDVVREIVAEDAEALKGMFGEQELKGLLAQVEPPQTFPTVGDDIKTEHECPKCGYRWRGGQSRHVGEEGDDSTA